jgi:hypothetical protein
MYDVVDFIYYIILLLLMIGGKLFHSDGYKIPVKYRFFTKPIFLLFIALIISSISGFAYHNQSPLLTLLAMRYFSYFLLYFVFISFGIKKKDMEKTIVIGAILYMIVFTIQLILYPKQIVPFDSSTAISRGFLRLRLEGVGFVTLTAFYSLNKYMLNKTNKKYLLMYFVCFIYVFILGFRTLLITFLFSTLMLLMIFNKASLRKFLSIMIAILIFGVLLWQVELFQVFVLDSIDTTENQTAQGDKYIRFLAFDFLFNKVNIDIGSLIMGNGMPFNGTEYGNLVLIEGAKRRGFISADLGLIGFTFNYGVLSLLVFLNIFRIAIFKNISKDGIYLKIFFIYLIISSITTAEIFRPGMFGVQMIALYLITITSFNNELTKTTKIK